MKNRKLLLGLVVFMIACINFSVNAQDWISLGPDNISGRSRAIIFDKFNDKVIYAGGVAGGLFISVNDGKNWQEIKLGDGSNLAVTALTQDNNGIIYVGTGEGFYSTGIKHNVTGMRGNGVYKMNTLKKDWAKDIRTDGLKYDFAKNNIIFTNLAFTRPADLSDGKNFINKMACDSKNNVFVATNSGLMLLKTDSWENVSESIPATAVVHDVKVSNTDKIAVAYNNSGYKVVLSQNLEHSPFEDILTLDTLVSEGVIPVIRGINRIELAFPQKNSNKIYAYMSYIDSTSIKNIILRTEDTENITWIRTSPESFGGGSETNIAMSICIDDRYEKEHVYVGSDVLYKGYDVNNSDIYYWETASSYMAPLNNEYFAGKNVHNILIKQDTTNTEDSTLIIIATDGGIFKRNLNNTLQNYGWEKSTKGMNTVQFYSVAVAPDASVAGGTEGNGTVYIANGKKLGNNKNGDIVWTVNSNGYDVNKTGNTSTSGGMTVSSAFQRILPTKRKSFYFSKPFAEVARTYGFEGNYTTIDDQNWYYRETLFSRDLFGTEIVMQNYIPYEPKVTPMLLWESVTSDFKDSIQLTLDTNITINGKKPKYGNIINAGDSLIAQSNQLGYPFIYKFQDELMFNNDTVLKIQTPVQSRLFLGKAQGIFMTDRANDYTLAPIRFSSLYLFSRPMNNQTTYMKNEVRCFGISNDGKELYVAVDSTFGFTESDVVTKVLRFDLSNINALKNEWDKNAAGGTDTNFFDLKLSPDFIPFDFKRTITSISVDKKNKDNILITLGGYFANQSNILLSTDGGNTFKEIENVDDSGSPILGNNQPIYSSLIESMNPANANTAYIGTENGVYRTSNFLGEVSGSKVKIVWEKMDGIPSVPVFDLKQQTLNLPEYKFYSKVGQTTVFNHYQETKLPGAIYAATYGKGLFAYLGDTIKSLPSVSIKDISNKTLDNALMIYPNPAQTYATINYSISTPSNVTFRLFDMNGRVVSSLEKGRQSVGEYTLPLNCQGLNKGIYMVQIILGNTTKTAKLVIQ